MSFVAPAAPAGKPAAFDPFAAQRAIFAAPLTSTAKLVALVLVQHMNADGACWPSLARLAKMASLSPSSVSRALRDLISDPSPLFGREQRAKPAKAGRGELDSTLYRWIGCPMVGQRTPTVGQPVAPSSGNRCPTVGQEQLTEQTSSNNRVKGDAPASFGERIWEMVEVEHGRLRKLHHDTTAPPEKVRKADREVICTFLQEAAEQARREWPEACAYKADDWAALVVRDLLGIWLERDGTDDYLRQRAHPLTALRSDLASIHADWRERWLDQIEKRFGKRPAAA